MHGETVKFEETVVYVCTIRYVYDIYLQQLGFHPVAVLLF